ncbi:MAG: diaminopropionate ammonia-lyase [Gammaproteobacteria bacterium]
MSQADAPPRECAQVLTPEDCASASAEIRTWPGYRPTPLRALKGMARAAGIDELLYKDESARFGLGSFKPLGGAYAVYRYLLRELAGRGIVEPVDFAELVAGRYAEIVSNLTVACATDGNHGRSVAWGAQMFGCACVVYIHTHVSEAREAAIASYGARMVRLAGTYDDAVERTASDARTYGWQVISDSSNPGYIDVPREVMAGYTVMIDEIVAEPLFERAPTHVFVQGGIGSLAAAVCAPLWWRYGAARPRMILVEPENAACLFASAVAGRRVRLDGDLETVMGGLACGEPSPIVWPLLSAGVHGFIHIDDNAALGTMRRLAAGEGDDAPVVGGESGVAGLAGCLALCSDTQVAGELGLDRRSRVLVFGTEGDTDAELYARIVGESGERVRARQASSGPA